METVFERINRKCEEAKKRLIIIVPKKVRKGGEEPYMREIKRGSLR